MTAGLAPDAAHRASAGPGPAAGRKRRLGGLPLVLLALGIALLSFALVRAAVASVTLAPVTATYAGAAPALTLPSYGPKGTDVVGYQHGADSQITLTLHNRGWLPMRIDRLAVVAGVAPLLDVRSVTGLPLELGPGESGTVRASAVLANCRYSHEREASLYEDVEVGWTVLGQRTATLVPLARPLMVRSPMIVGCPDRKLDRQADNRRDLTGQG